MTSRRAGIIVGLAALLAVSAGLRFYRLGAADTRADEVELIEFLQAGIGPVEYFKHIAKGFQSGRQMPLPRVATSAYVTGLGLDVTLFNVRAPYAALSSLLPLFLVLLGWRWAGPRLGWILGVLGAISPFAVYWSRVGHVYGFVQPLVAALAALFVPLFQEAAAGRPPPLKYLVAAAVIAELGCYSHLSVWPVAGLLWLALLILHLKANRWKVSAIPARLWVCLVLWGLPLAPWAFAFLTAPKDAWDMATAVSDTDPIFQLSAMKRLPFVLGWGAGFVGSALTFGLPALGVVLAWRNRTLRPGLQLVLALGLLLSGLLMYMMRSDGIFTLRYFGPVWLPLLLLAALAVHESAALFGARFRAVPAFTAALLAGMALHVGAPLWWTLNLPGHPTPYTLINRWMDAHLPKGSLVIVDRWFEPSHEMRFHAPSNVTVTFTVPNEPLKNFLGFRWRDTVKQFAARHPDAAYLELTKCYFYVPGVGGWDWPRQYFARHAIITNEPALKLRERWLGMTEDYYADNTNRIVCEVFYNTTEDLIAKARAAGQRLFLKYGEGWRHVKTQQDFRDWRLLEGVADLEVFNLADAPLDARLTVRGVSVEGVKRVQSSTGAQETFPANRMHEWTLDVPALAPGRTVVRLTDGLWNAARTPLLVEDLRLAAP